MHVQAVTFLIIYVIIKNEKPIMAFFCDCFLGMFFDFFRILICLYIAGVRCAGALESPHAALHVHDLERACTDNTIEI